MIDAAGADDGHLGRNDDEIGEPSADHAEIRQGDGRATQLLRWDRPRRGVGAQPVETGAQVVCVALADVAHDRYDEAALGIDGNADVDALDQPPLARLGVVPCVERRLGLTRRGNGPHEPDGDVLALAPILDVRLLGHRSSHHLGVRGGHALRHGAAHAAQWLGGAGFGKTLGGALDVGAGASASRVVFSSWPSSPTTVPVSWPCPSSANSTRGSPTLIRSPFVPNKRAMRPLQGEGTSTTALSVSTDTSG